MHKVKKLQTLKRLLILINRAIGQFAIASSDGLVGRPQNGKRAAAALVFHVVRPQIPDPNAFGSFPNRSDQLHLFLN